MPRAAVLLAPLFALVSALACAPARAQRVGEAPQNLFGVMDIAQAAHLPPLENRPGDPLWKALAGTQVLTRALRLNLRPVTAVEAWRAAASTYAAGEAAAAHSMPAAPTVFQGTLGSQLNALIARPGIHAIRVASPDLTLDVPLHIRRGGLTLDLAQANLRMTTPGPFMLLIDDAQQVRVTGGRFQAGPWGLLIANSRQVVVQNTDMQGLAGGGIFLTNAADCTLWDNTLHALAAAPILLHGNTVRSVIAHNRITGNLNFANLGAGIVLTDRNRDPHGTVDGLLHPERYPLPNDRLLDRLHIPAGNVVAFNTVEANRSSGIYSDGGIRNVIVDNQILRNAKEGLCLDNGSTGNIVAYNHFQGDGERWGQTDLDLQREFVSQYGRLPDGTAVAKVPAISLDNAVYNQVAFNQVDDNFGSGIKMVRTAFYNLVALNTVADNNRGRNARFHFFGIELGFATPDMTVPDLDFLPSRGNQFFSNLIRGPHYAGIFLPEGCDRNQVIDNSIFGATNWAMESTRRQPNLTLNNISNQPSRNIDPGLDPNLAHLSAGQFDN